MSDRSLRRDLEFRSRSRSFVLRLWREELDADLGEWRGQLCDVTTGEVRYFRDWPGLISSLEKMLDDAYPATEERR